MLETALGIFHDFNLIIKNTIDNFLIPYGLEASKGMFTKYLPLTMQVGFYILIAVVSFSILKLFYPFKKWVHYVLIYLIFFLVMDVFFIFIEFFEILYS